MIRIKPSKLPTGKPDLILTADWHLREDTPICRTDDFWEAQWKKVQAVKRLQEQFNCPVIHAGDLFDHWKPSPYLLSTTLKYLPYQFWTVYGNHDLPQHNLDLAHKCGINTVEEAGRLTLLSGIHWGTDILLPADKAEQHLGCGMSFLAWHTMVWSSQTMRPSWAKNDSIAADLLLKYPQYNLIVTGHNHQAFSSSYKGRLLVNPGSLTRQASDQIEHRPCVWLWYAETNEAVHYELPIEKNVISREHIERIEQRDQRIEAFIERLTTDWDADVSFEKNLEIFERENEVSKAVMEIIRRAVEC